MRPIACSTPMPRGGNIKEINDILLRNNDVLETLEEENIAYLPLKHAPCAQPNVYNLLLSGVSHEWSYARRYIERHAYP